MQKFFEKEVERICKEINPNWDGASFDYDCSCYKSALKAYKSLAEDGHSGFSWAFTASILKRMVDGLPLTPITDEDFDAPDAMHGPINDDGTVTTQCPRMSSLFKDEKPDGSISYHDLYRQYCYNIEFPDDTFGCKEERIVDELFPITMPYYPTGKKFKVALREFLCDKDNGDFDHVSIEYVITPDNEKIIIGKYYKEENDVKIEISKEEFEADEKRRIDTIEKKVAHRLFFELEDKITILTQSQKDEIIGELEKLCTIFKDVNPDYRRYSFLRTLVGNMNDINSNEKEMFKEIIDYVQKLKREYVIGNNE